MSMNGNKKGHHGAQLMQTWDSRLNLIYYRKTEFQMLQSGQVPTLNPERGVSGLH